MPGKEEDIIEQIVLDRSGALGTRCMECSSHSKLGAAWTQTGRRLEGLRRKTVWLSRYFLSVLLRGGCFGGGRRGLSAGRYQGFWGRLGMFEKVTDLWVGGVPDDCKPIGAADKKKSRESGWAQAELIGENGHSKRTNIDIAGAGPPFRTQTAGAEAIYEDGGSRTRI